MSFFDQNFVRYCLSLPSLSFSCHWHRHCWHKLFTFSPSSPEPCTRPNSTKLSTNHLWIKAGVSINMFKWRALPFCKEIITKLRKYINKGVYILLYSFRNLKLAYSSQLCGYYWYTGRKFPQLKLAETVPCICGAPANINGN